MNGISELKSQIYLQRGVANYGKKNYKNAIKDFEKITDRELDSKKHHFIGLCYYRLNLYDKTKKEYYKSIEQDPTIPEVYYDLGVLYNSKNKTDTAKKLFETCINIESNFGLAWDALEKLENLTQLNWLDWWFGKKRKKSIFGGLLIFSLFTLIILMVGMAIKNSINENQIIAIVSSLIILLIILLSPNIKNIKVGNVELSISDNILQQSVVLEPSSPSMLMRYERYYI